MTKTISKPDFLLQTNDGWIPINKKAEVPSQTDGVLFVLVPCSIDDKPIYAGPKNSDVRFVKWNGAFGAEL